MRFFIINCEWSNFGERSEREEYTRRAGLRGHAKRRERGRVYFARSFVFRRLLAADRHVTFIWSK